MFYLLATTTNNEVKIRVYIVNAMTGQGLSGVTNSSANLKVAIAGSSKSAPLVFAANDNNIEPITTIGTYERPSRGSKCRFGAVDDTDMTGVYEIHFHPQVFMDDQDNVYIVKVFGVMNMMDTVAYIQRFHGDLLNDIADISLTRDWKKVRNNNVGGFTTLQALRKLRNKVRMFPKAKMLEVYTEDGKTLAYLQRVELTEAGTYQVIGWDST